MATQKLGSVIVSDNTIDCISETFSISNEMCIIDTTIEIVDGILTLTGDRIEYELTHVKRDNLEKYEDNHIQYGYKSIIDIFRHIKRPYVNGWVQLKETTSISITFSNWILIQKDEKKD